MAMGPHPSSACEQALAFGPVPSRRLGLSLGVNVVPRKVCTYNCVYCQLGRTTLLTTDRREYTPTSAVVEAVADKVAQAERTDYVTVIGDGEPTLASNLGDIIEGVRRGWPGRTGLMTNGSLMWMPEVGSAAALFDVVMPTVSAGDSRTFRRLHRPHRAISFGRYVQGVSDFSAAHPDKVWAEVMLVQGANDSPESLRAIGALIGQIRPAEVHLTSPIRPPSVSSVRPPSAEAVELALRAIPGAVDFTHPEKEEMPGSSADPVQHLVDIAGTHPLRREQAVAVLTNAGISREDAELRLDSMERAGALVELARGGSRFYVRGRRRAGHNTFK